MVLVYLVIVFVVCGVYMVFYGFVGRSRGMSFNFNRNCVSWFRFKKGREIVLKENRGFVKVFGLVFDK